MMVCNDDGWMDGADEIIVAVEYPTAAPPSVVVVVALETMMTPSRNNERSTSYVLRMT